MVSSQNLEILRSVLEHAFYEVIHASTADQGVALSLNHSLAGVVLDSEFLTEQGWTLAQTLKGLRPAVPVLLFATEPCEIKVPHVLDGVVHTHADLLEYLSSSLQRNTADANAGP